MRDSASPRDPITASQQLAEQRPEFIEFRDRCFIVGIGESNQPPRCLSHRLTDTVTFSTSLGTSQDLQQRDVPAEPGRNFTRSVRSIGGHEDFNRQAPRQEIVIRFPDCRRNSGALVVGPEESVTDRAKETFQPSGSWDRILDKGCLINICPKLVNMSLLACSCDQAGVQLDGGPYLLFAGDCGLNSRLIRLNAPSRP